MSDLDLKIVTAEGEMFSGRVDSVTAPGDLGEFTVLPSHVRIISSLSAGSFESISDIPQAFFSKIVGA